MDVLEIGKGIRAVFKQRETLAGAHGKNKIRQLFYLHIYEDNSLVFGPIILNWQHEWLHFSCVQMLLRESVKSAENSGKVQRLQCGRKW